MNNLLLKSYLRCKRKAWLDYKGDKKYKSWSAQNSIQIINQYKNFNLLTNGNLFSGLKACERGYKGVIGLKISQIIKDDLNAVAYPPLLIKSKGRSKWGEYKYIPVVSKLGRKTTKEHYSELALCSILLESFEEVSIDHGLVISTFKNKFNYEKILLNKKLKNKTIDIFSDMVACIKGNIPKITEDRKKCSICPWKNFCDKEAKSKGYLTDIDGIGKKTASTFQTIGILNFKQLAKSNQQFINEKLSKLQQTDFEKTTKFINQSKSYLNGIPIKNKEYKNLSKIVFQEKAGFFVFDIESDPDEKHDFLYGFITIKRDKSKEYFNYYEPILNLKNDENTKHVDKIFNKLFSENDWPVLHYGETEKITIMKLAKKASLTTNQIQALNKRFIDLHLLIRETWTLPIKNYSLKTVANWIGFKWQGKNVSGSKALFWWIQYNETLNESFLQKIIEYNKDDCLATLNIANWLIKN